MDSIEIIKAIFDADKEASRIREEARALREDKDKLIAVGIERLNLKYENELNSSVTQAEKTESERASAEIARLDAQTDARLALLRENFESSREDYIDKIFSMITRDADG